jgi:hypothetical protein
LQVSLQGAADRGLLHLRLRTQRDFGFHAFGQAPGLQGLQQHLALDAALLVLDARAHVLQSDAADVPAQRFAGRRIRLGSRSGPQEVVDVAAAGRVAQVGQGHALGGNAPHHQVATQQRQGVHRQGGLVERREGVGPAGLTELHLLQRHLQAGKHAQTDGPVDHQGAVVALLHPVDRHALVFVGVEGGDQHGSRGHQQHQNEGHGDERATNPDRHGRAGQAGG